ncbi:MAG: glycosyl transferase family 2 [Candidatus Pacebacteria bacterium CG_4_10_14_0_8_um_filter_42_14]|nr:MAG: glycosyl transferase family 2 [Candidatus Pacebacteria bacterium CG_4_10_14_0_8_um_filter_42_14]
MKKTKTDLELIFLTYNSEFWIKKALSSLQEFYLQHTKKSVTVTVVDNDSTDDTIKVIKKDFPWVKVIMLEENVGFSTANNVALAQSKAKYAMLVNSDVEFTADSNLDVLIQYMSSHPRVGVVTPRLSFFNGSLDPACHRGEPTLWASFAYFSRLEKMFPNSPKFGQYHQTYKNLNSIHEIDACSGAALLARVSAFKNVGLLDEQFFMYAEDLDWCKRFREENWQVVYDPKVEMIHHKYKSGIKQSSQSIAKRTRQHFYNTMLQYFDKHYAKDYPGFVRALVKYFLELKKGGV